MSSVHNATGHSVCKGTVERLFLFYVYGAVCPDEAALAAPFLLPGLADQVLNGYTLAAVQHHVVQVFLNLRHIQNTNEVVVDHDPLRPVLSLALSMVHVDALNKLMQG